MNLAAIDWDFKFSEKKDHRTDEGQKQTGKEMKATFLPCISERLCLFSQVEQLIGGLDRWAVRQAGMTALVSSLLPCTAP